ncbi:hypothetical protein ACOSQ2_011054 [Xanthoceras sorbifolium]
MVGFKINVDAATNSVDNSFGVRVMVRDWKGSIVCASALFFPFFFSAEVAEARTILKGVLLAGSRGLSPIAIELSLITIESDALSVVALCNGSSISRADIDLVVQDILVFSSVFAVINFSFVCRQCNLIAHSLAIRVVSSKAFSC